MMCEDEDEELKLKLQDVGVEVNSVYDLINAPPSFSYKLAIPILISTLKAGIEDRWIKEGVIRALCTKEARGTEAASALINEYWRMLPGEHSVRWAIGNTFSVIADASHFEEIAKILKDKRNGSSRQEFADALKRIKTREAEDLLIDLLDDDEVAAHALGVIRGPNFQRAREGQGTDNA